MLTKSNLYLIKQLLLNKKARYENKLFVAEGTKIVLELLSSEYEVSQIYVTDKWLAKKNIYLKNNIKIEIISEKELSRISSVKTPEGIIAIVKIKERLIDNVSLNNNITLVLDNIQDPGNLGTIIRLCDWFGVKNIICSQNTVDCYNPKVINSSKGSIFRVNVLYTDISIYLQNCDNKNIEIFGMITNGDNIYKTKLHNKNAIYILGNESNGISENIKKYIKHKIGIPKYKTSQTESLNVAISTSIMFSEIRRYELQNI